MLTFQLTPYEEKEAKKWANEHRWQFPCPLATFSYTFCQTIVGLGVSMTCNQCKQEKNITDYDSW